MANIDDYQVLQHFIAANIEDVASQDRKYIYYTFLKQLNINYFNFLNRNILNVSFG